MKQTEDGTTELIVQSCNRLRETDVEQLRAELITRTGELQTMSEEKAALQAMVNDLREAIDNAFKSFSTGVADTFLRNAINKTPAQSLADRDMQIAEKVRSACINSVELGGEEADQEIINRDWRSPAQEAANLSVRYARSNIRNLNLSEVISDEY